MRTVLLDEGVPRQIAAPLRESGFAVTTAQQAGLAGVENGRLLRAAEGHFDLLLTADQNMYAQQSLTGRHISIVVLPTNRLPVLLPRVADIVTVMSAIVAATYVQIGRDGAVTTRAYGADAGPAVLARLEPFAVGRG